MKIKSITLDDDNTGKELADAKVKLVLLLIKHKDVLTEQEEVLLQLLKEDEQVIEIINKINKS